MKALIVTKNENTKKILQNLFRLHLPKVEILFSKDHEEASESLSQTTGVKAILIDMSDPLDLNSVVQEIFNTVKKQPLIFLGDQDTINDDVVNQIYEVHSESEIIYLPIDENQFKTILQKAIRREENDNIEESIEKHEENSLLPMKLRNFYLFDQVPFDIFMELSDANYMKILDKNTKYTYSFLSLYAKRNVRYLHIEKDKYIEFLELSLKKITKNFKKDIDKPEDAFPIQIKAASIIQQLVHAVGVTDPVAELIPKVLSVAQKIVHKNSHYATLLKDFPIREKDTAEHSVLCLYTCLYMYKHMGWQSELVLQRLCLSSYIQDCSLKDDQLVHITSQDDPEFEKLSEEDQQLYLSHCTTAAHIANQFSAIPNTDFIIAEHHERPDGTGFPAKLNAKKMTVISCLFNYASNYARQILSTGITEDALIEVFKSTRPLYDTGNFKEPLEAFASTIKKQGP